MLLKKKMINMFASQSYTNNLYIFIVIQIFGLGLSQKLSRYICTAA